MIRYLIILSLVIIAGHAATAQQTAIRNNYVSENGLPHLVIERAMIYTPQNEWLYNHHPSITQFKGKLIAIWSDGLIGEDSPGQRVVFSVSTDFKNWSPMKTLASPFKGPTDTLNVLTAAGFYQFKDTLVAYYGEYEHHRTNTHLWAVYTTDGKHWSSPIDMHLPLIPNHGPEATNSGRLIISGNFSFPYTDNHTGLTGWKMNSFYPAGFYTQDNSAAFYAPAKKMGFTATLRRLIF